jgi:hypothetical protein
LYSALGSPHEIGTLTIRNTFFYTSFFKRSEEKRSVSPSGGQGCFILLRESKKGGSSGAQQLFTSYFYKQTVPTERKYSLFDGLSKTLQSSRLFVAINEDIIALRRSRLKVNLQRMKQPWPGWGCFCYYPVVSFFWWANLDGLSNAPIYLYFYPVIENKITKHKIQ